MDELNVKCKNWKDLLDDSIAFKKSDIIHIQVANIVGLIGFPVFTAFNVNARIPRTRGSPVSRFSVEIFLIGEHVMITLLSIWLCFCVSLARYRVIAKPTQPGIAGELWMGAAVAESVARRGPQGWDTMHYYRLFRGRLINEFVSPLPFRRLATTWTTACMHVHIQSVPRPRSQARKKRKRKPHVNTSENSYGKP